MTRRKARRIRRKANAWAREERRRMLRHSAFKRWIYTTSRLRERARGWPWPRCTKYAAQLRW